MIQCGYQVETADWYQKTDEQRCWYQYQYERELLESSNDTDINTSMDDVGGNIIAYLKTVTFGLLTRPRSVRYASYVQLTNLWAAIYELWALKAIPQTTTLWNG